MSRKQKENELENQWNGDDMPRLKMGSWKNVVVAVSYLPIPLG